MSAHSSVSFYFLHELLSNSVPGHMFLIVVIFKFYSCIAGVFSAVSSVIYFQFLSTCLSLFLISVLFHSLSHSNLALPHFSLVTSPITCVPLVTGGLHARSGAHTDPLSGCSLSERVSAAGSGPCMEEGKECSTIPCSQIPINR